MTGRLRIGQGFDAHRFAAERDRRPLVLGGVQVPYPQGLAAHSDGDVALHALIDALLGAAALGDIGQWFPDTSAAFERIDSRLLLREVMRRIGDLGYTVVNVDLTVIAQRPKLAPYIAAMRDGGVVRLVVRERAISALPLNGFEAAYAAAEQACVG